jgi:hypothetical protein
MGIGVHKSIRHYSRFTKNYTITVYRGSLTTSIYFTQNNQSQSSGLINLPNKIAQTLAYKIIEALVSKEESYDDEFSVDESIVNT